jgi:DNA-binding NarL/FixJ family response regulator
MASDSPSIITVLAASAFRAEALALSISRKIQQKVSFMTEPRPGTCSSKVIVEVDTNLDATLDLIRHATSQRSDAAVVVLGAVESEEQIARLAEAGASGYIPAHASFQEMLAVIHSARKGEFSCTTDVTYVLFSRLAELARSQEANCFLTSGLTIRERQVLELLAQGLSNKEIGNSLCISEVTVKNHVHRLLGKVGVRDRRVVARLPELSARRVVHVVKQTRVGERNKR